MAKREMQSVLKDNRALRAKNPLLRNATLLQPMSPNKELKGTMLKSSKTELGIKNQKTELMLKNSKTELKLGGKHILNQIRQRQSQDIDDSFFEDKHDISLS